MDYNIEISSKNKFKQLVLFYIKLNVWINIGKSNSSHFTCHEMLFFFNLNTLLNLNGCMTHCSHLLLLCFQEVPQQSGNRKKIWGKWVISCQFLNYNVLVTLERPKCSKHINRHAWKAGALSCSLSLKWAGTGHILISDFFPMN